MFARPIALIALAIAACAPVKQSTATVSAARAQGEALATACKGRDGWSDVAPPARIYGNTYYVGSCGISVLLVTSSKGHVLVDGATDEAAPSILANIRALGFNLRDVRFIVGSHEHVDHMGAFAALKAATGAKLLVSAAARPVVETGKTDADDPQFGIIPDMKPVSVDSILAYQPQPGMIITGEPTKVMSLIPHMTPGRTNGGTSWTWQSCEGAKCVTFAYVDSLSEVSRDDYRFTDHPERVAPFRETFERVSKMPCDILVTPHPGVSDLFDRLRGAKPLVDPAGCRTLVQAMRKRLDDRLAKERAR